MSELKVVKARFKFLNWLKQPLKKTELERGSYISLLGSLSEFYLYEV